MNKNQKIILAIFIPIIFFFIALVIANIAGIQTALSVEVDAISGAHTPHETLIHKPFNWQRTWYVWMLYIIFCCIFEYKLFADKKKKDIIFILIIMVFLVLFFKGYSHFVGFMGWGQTTWLSISILSILNKLTVVVFFLFGILALLKRYKAKYSTDKM